MLKKPMLKLPAQLDLIEQPHKEWLQMLDEAQATVEEEDAIQQACAKTLRIQGRSVPPDMLGRWYASYCNLINRMYDAYLKSVHLQRLPYIIDIIKVLVKRMYELRNELVHVIVNDYIYVDPALAQLRMTPYDIEIVVPYHFATESRSEDIEEALQKMWAEAIRRKRPKKPKPILLPPAEVSRSVFGEIVVSSQQQAQESVEEEEEDEEETPPSSVHTIIPESYSQAVMIQKHERARQWFMADFRAKCTARRRYFTEKHIEPPIELRHKAARVIQMVYRQYMQIKRQRLAIIKRDILLGILQDPCRSGKLCYKEENDKIYAMRRNTRLKIKQTYLKELEKETTRIIMLKKEEQICDITDQIREWFKEWYYGYGFFPQYPYPVEGGTILVIRGDYPTVEEQLEKDANPAQKGRTKEQLKQERMRVKNEAKQKAAVDRDKKKKEAMALFKARCNPFDDPGYKIETSEATKNIIEALSAYRATWSIYDDLPAEFCGHVVYGYLKPLLQEDIMYQLHKDCRLYVDELMRLDLKMLIQAHQAMYRRLELQYPKIQRRKKPKVPALPKTLVVDQTLLKNIEHVFDLDLVTKPTTKLNDVYGDFNFAAYEYNVRDPDAMFPSPGYGDVKQRLMLSCILATGIQPGATRNRAVLLLGPPNNGKSFLADAVAGELNAVKIDITPEVFSAISKNPAKDLTQVLLAARAFQPAVIFMKNIERVYCKKVLPENKPLQATQLRNMLPRLVRQIPEYDKVIFIATCSDPFVAQAGPMTSLFDEIILVPLADYGSLQKFFREQLHGEASVPVDFPIQPVAQLCQGYGFGAVIDAYHEVMSPERIVTMNVNPLNPGEFLEALLDKGEMMSSEDYQKYIDFFIENSPLRTERKEYAIINERRKAVYEKMAKKKQAAASSSSKVK